MERFFDLLVGCSSGVPDILNLINQTRGALNNFQIPQNDNSMLLDAFDQFPSIAVDNESDCAICLDQINTGKLVKQLPSCEHIFHDKCIKAWVQGGTMHAQCVVSNYWQRQRHKTSIKCMALPQAPKWEILQMFHQ
ncbi:hypothetical protein niasHS_016050 [Heterodera schachtii]|uniref:RING-type domain-containing protein n=1 Tax=Heterodera schachtii TaxID=97005 RepID=A0ABD2HZ70_HETSC